LLKELMAGKTVSGVKQSRRAVRDGLARAVYLARDADPAVTGPVRDFCRSREVPVVEQFAMRELGQAAGIQVDSAAVALLKG
jgi:large subunit ribosomal protein L7A